MTWWPRQRRKSAHIDEAQAHIDQLEEQQPEVDQLGRDLGRIRSRNHFAASIAKALRGAS